MPDLFQLPKVTPFSAGSSMPGAKLHFFQTGTSTPQNTYQDAALTTPHANPVIADTNGVFAPIFLDPNLPDYRVTLTDSANVTQTGYPVDNYPALSTGGSGLLYVRYAEDTSLTANSVTVTLASPAVTAYTAGLMIEVVFANTVTNTSVTINVNGLGVRNIKHSDDSSLIAGEIRAGQTVLLAYRSSSSTFHVLSITGSMSIGSGTAAIPAIRSYAAQDAGFFLDADNWFHISKGGVDFGFVDGCRVGTTAVQLTGFASPISTSIAYQVTANVANIQFANRTLDNKNATSTTTAMTMTGLDTSILGSGDRYAYCYGIYDNGTLKGGLAYYSGGTIYFTLGFDGTGTFTASGTKGLYKFWSVLLPM